MNKLIQITKIAILTIILAEEVRKAILKIIELNHFKREYQLLVKKLHF